MFLMMQNQVDTMSNKKEATIGNGSQVSFITNSRSIVDKFHELGLQLGATSEGSGGERPEGSGVYYSYIRDLDGNKICAFTNNKQVMSYQFIKEKLDYLIISVGGGVTGD